MHVSVCLLTRDSAVKQRIRMEPQNKTNEERRKEIFWTRSPSFRRYLSPKNWDTYNEGSKWDSNFLIVGRRRTPSDIFRRRLSFVRLWSKLCPKRDIVDSRVLFLELKLVAMKLLLNAGQKTEARVKEFLINILWDVWRFNVNK